MRTIRKRMLVGKNCVRSTIFLPRMPRLNCGLKGLEWVFSFPPLCNMCKLSSPLTSSPLRSKLLFYTGLLNGSL